MPPRATTETLRKIVLIATEESGDRLGANLMKVLRQRLGGAVRFEGVAKAGLAGMAVIAGNTIAAESQEMIVAADRAGLFIQGLPA